MKRRKTTNKISAGMRWTLLRASVEFGVTRETIRRGLVANGVKAEKATFTTPQITAAIFGSHQEAKLRTELQRERKLKIANDERAGLLVEKAKMAQVVAPTLRSIRDLLYQKLENEAPVSMSSVDVPTARIIGRRMAGELCERWQQVFKAWNV